MHYQRFGKFSISERIFGCFAFAFYRCHAPRSEWLNQHNGVILFSLACNNDVRLLIGASSGVIYYTTCYQKMKMQRASSLPFDYPHMGHGGSKSAIPRYRNVRLSISVDPDDEDLQNCFDYNVVFIT